MKVGVLSGSRYFWQGAGKLCQQGLRRYVIVPVLTNAVLMSALSYVAVSWLHGNLHWLLSHVPEWLSWLYWLAMPLAVVTLLLIAGYFFSTLLVLIASPFNGLLSQAVEEGEGERIPAESIVSLVIRTAGREWVKLLYIAPRYLGLLVISMIPVLNLASPLLWFWFGSWVMAMQYVDYSFDNHGVHFDDMRSFLARQPLAVTGFGATVALLMAVPVVNCFVMPAAVIGGTLLRLELMNIKVFNGEG